ncbi:MAG: alpha/beta hydrolase [Methanoregulaceae archaeon]|nr:alpha/beta hydrolase [Methanoregulaceae archaeon]
MPESQECERRIYRLYGTAPFQVVVLHGGPGAAGEMAPVAQALSVRHGVLEPLLYSLTVESQLDDLERMLAEHATFPVTLIGFSFGAFLGFLYAARRPDHVKKLVLVSSGPFEESYAGGIFEARMSRLAPGEREEVGTLLEALSDQGTPDKDKVFTRFGALMEKADAFDPANVTAPACLFSYETFRAVWTETATLRRSGALAETGVRIECPVVVLHGDYDPHPASGVRVPLGKYVKEFRFISIPRCGHKPWNEREARDRFFEVLENELTGPADHR